MNDLAVQTFNVNDSLFFNVQKFEHAQRIGAALASATMIPEHYRKNVGNCLIALNLAERMQADPMMVMQNTYIVHGKPGIEAKLAIALINTSGRFEPLKYKYETDQSGEVVECCAYAKEKATGEVLDGPEVTWKMVQAEGWNKNPKWNSMRKLMFTYRAAMFFARINIPEALLGFYTTEEIIEMQPTGNGTYTAPEQKAADLTEKVKEKPEYKPLTIEEELIENTKTKLEEKVHLKKAETTPTVDPQTGADLEQGEPVGVLPKGTDPIEWMVSCRPSSSVSNAKAFIAVYKEQKDAIDRIDGKIQTQLENKLDKTMAHLAKIEANKKEIAEAEEQPPIPEDDQIPAFEQDPQPDTVNGRLKFLKAMKDYKNLNSDIYAEVLQNNDLDDMNATKPGDEGVILGFMDKAFEV